MLCGGFPCQSFSIAGKRRGFEDTRGTMFFEIARILEVKRPKFILLENVKGLLNHNKGETFSVIIQTLEELGYRTEWMVLNSKFHGVPQNRERVFIIGSLRGECRPEILPFRQNDSETDGEIHSEGMEQVAQTLRARDYSNWNGNFTADGNIRCLSGGGHSGGLHSDMTFLTKQPNIKQLIGGSQGYRVYSTDGTSTTLAGQAGGVGAKTGLYAVLTPDREEKRQNGRRFKGEGEPMFTITKTDIHGVFDGFKIRRLTPIECERLQGFPDGWTESTSFINSVKLVGNIWQYVKLKDVKEELSAESCNSVLNIIKDGENGEMQISLTQNKELMTENAKKDAVGLVSVEDGVCDITNHGNVMAIHFNPSKTSKIEVITKKAHIIGLMEKQTISPYLKITLEENLPKEKLSTTLTSIKEIIKSQIFISAKTEKPITTAIIVSKKLEQNSLNEALLDLRTETISYFSDTQRYKMMGNAVTTNVIKAIMEAWFK